MEKNPIENRPPHHVPKEKKSSKRKLTAADRAFEKVDLRKDLKKLEQLLHDLKVDYEQYFLGLVPFQPDQLHREVKRLIRKIRKAPFKKLALRYKQLMLEQRYQAYHDYWQKVLRQKEEGTYSRDLFKAELREKLARETAEQQTSQGQAQAAFKGLFDTYRQALEQLSGRKENLDYNNFKKTLLKQARIYSQQLGTKHLSFKVVVKEGRVLIKAQAL